jgi:hypothetical protein
MISSVNKVLKLPGGWSMLHVDETFDGKKSRRTLGNFFALPLSIGMLVGVSAPSRKHSAGSSSSQDGARESTSLEQGVQEGDGGGYSLREG